MNQNILFALNRLKEKLWLRPLIFCVLSVFGALLASIADSNSHLNEIVPKIKTESLEQLLSTISGSMLVISIFAVGSMISAFSAASNTATPRSFKLITADDVSQNALSVFIGSFIYSIVAMVALKNGYYGKAGHFILFLFTLLFFALVIVTFLRWVERISKLGRMGHTIKLVEDATTNAIKMRLKFPTLNGIAINPNQEKGMAIYSDTAAYVQQINISKLQKNAETLDAIITVNAIPGSFATLDKPLFYILLKSTVSEIPDSKELKKAFTMGDMRYFDEDPRFGLITLSEIASRALSPAVNDPGTAIQIIGSYVRLFSLWDKTSADKDPDRDIYDRIAVPEISIDDLFIDAFRPISRDGAGNIEVMIRLQKAFSSISIIDNIDLKKASLLHSQEAFARAKLEMKYEIDLEVLRKESLFT
ncbi:DUF2254 domain-containing protein [Flavobacterium frigoris]|uniref:Membrane protein n=1 Tax=Flavobacterium frigoris (strain PS1) TaxID=1086011 RepID=H7FTI5_FLAFP|nr:DUF2254 domain-containing protein [Flavobacterium frigoris]EIA08389.1 membrane protein [Flavobacterium frigoris PS1]